LQISVAAARKVNGQRAASLPALAAGLCGGQVELCPCPLLGSGSGTRCGSCAPDSAGHWWMLSQEVAFSGPGLQRMPEKSLT